MLMHMSLYYIFTVNIFTPYPWLKTKTGGATVRSVVNHYMDSYNVPYFGVDIGCSLN